MRIALLFIAFLATAFTLNAQNYSLPSGNIVSSGGASAGGSFSIEGSTTSTAAPSSSGGAFTISGGFFSQYAALQTLGAPHLVVRSITTNRLQIAWPANVPGWQVQRNNADLNPSAWSDIAGTPATSGAEQYVTISAITGGRIFFRLRKL